MKGSVKLPVFIDDARKLVNTTQLRAKYLGASYEAEYCQWQALHGLGSLMETASLIITPNAYLEGKLLASYPPDPIGDFDVTRATTATRVNSAGLVELVPYNLFTYSEQFDNADWSKSSGTITANSTTAPNGTTTADLFTANGTLSNHDFFEGFTGGSQTTASIYVKKNSTQYVYISLNYQSSGVNWATGIYDLDNLTTATFQSGGVTNQVATISDAGNGWRRITLKVDTANTSLYCMYGVADSMSPTLGSRGRVENSSSTSFYAWGAQVVEGSVAKDYQKTETRLNIPRLDYSNGTCPSLLVEPQRTNLLTWSSSFDNAAWVKSQSIITANATTAPDGTLTADKIIEDTSLTGYHQTFQTGIVASLNSYYTFSFYAKSAERTEIYALNQIQNLYGVLFDLSTGTYSVLSGSPSSVTMDDVGNGWYRCSISGISTQALLTYNNLIISKNGVQNYAGDGTSGLYVWGAQLEAGSYPTSYIPTTSASVTRNADVISKTGISSLIGQTEGTLFIDFTWDGQTSSTIASISDGTEDNNIMIYILSVGTIRVYSTALGVFDYYDTSVTAAIGTQYRIAVGYKSNDLAVYINGSSVATSSSVSIPATSVFAIGAAGNGSYRTAAEYKSLALWKTRLTNAQLATLTTI